MQKHISRTASAAVFLLLLACGFSTEKRVPDSVKKVVESREVKKVTEAEIMARTVELGDSIRLMVQKEYLEAITTAYKQGGYEKAAPLCDIQSLKVTQGLSQHFSVAISRVSDHYRNQENKPDAMESSILEAFKYSFEHGDRVGSNVQFMHPGDSVLYNRPVFLSDPVCMNCHGTTDELSEEVRAKLDQEYPQDQAIGYQIGDMMGMWSFKFQRGEIVKYL